MATAGRTDVDRAGQPRWRGQPGRLEVHYLTATDTATGTGLWLHHEVVAPLHSDSDADTDTDTDTDTDAYAHGWIATFPVGAAPTCERFGPTAVEQTRGDDWFRAGDVVMTATTARGRAGSIDWDLTWEPGAPPLWTFPRWAWQRKVLPAAQVVPMPTARLTGTVGGTSYDGPAGVAHIDGHGNAQRWVWLHADLGGGDVLEIVAATARRPGLRVLPRLPLLQLRVEGQDWPHDPLAAAPLLRARVDGDRFTVRGTVGTRRIRVSASLPADRCVVLGYVDPDGATATCTNTERADATVELDRLTAGGWRTHRSWTLDGTAHAEIGRRP